VTITDPEVLEVLRAEPELLAIVDALQSAHARNEPSPLLRQRRSPWVRVSAVAVVAATVIALVLASPWDSGSGPSLVDRALAAVGNRPVLHALLRYSIGTRIDLRTGRSSPILRYGELWYDADRHIVRAVAKLDGRVVSRVTGTGTLQGLEDPVFIATLYRKALAQGKVHKVGDGIVRGHRVIVLEARGRTGAMRAALDAKTFQLVRLQLFDAGRLQFQFDVLLMETLTREQAHLPRTAPELAALTSTGGGTSVATQPGKKAPTVFTRPALWAGPSIGGRKLSSVLIWNETSQRSGGPIVRADVLHVDYGAPSGLGGSPFLEIDEAPAAQAAPLWRSDGDYTPPAGYVDLSSSTAGSGPHTQRVQWTGLLQKNGFYVRLTSWSREALLAAARALRPAPLS
jgi:hypothetical protein